MTGAERVGSDEPPIVVGFLIQGQVVTLSKPVAEHAANWLRAIPPDGSEHAVSLADRIEGVLTLDTDGPIEPTPDEGYALYSFLNVQLHAGKHAEQEAVYNVLRPWLVDEGLVGGPHPRSLE